MRIGIFVTSTFVRPEYAEAVSGHVQIPLMAARMLAATGHDVTMITTRGPGADLLPGELPEKVKVRLVPHATRPWPQRGVYVGKASRQVIHLLSLLRKERFDVVHFFGGTATGWLLCVLKTASVRSLAFYTPIRSPGWYSSRLGRRVAGLAFTRVSRIIAMTDHVSLGWASLVGTQKTLVMRPGIMKQISQTPTRRPKNSVLFWRNAGYSNGADLAIQSFGMLAPRHPNIRFVFAVRPHDRYEQELLRLERSVENIDVYIYPYGGGISLARLLSEALFVVQPFRQLSINPQTSILETLYAGVPVIATDIESNREVVQQERNGLLIPPGEERALSLGIERLLQDAGLLAKLTRNARPTTESRWNWGSFCGDLLQVYLDAGNADGTKSHHGV